MQPVPVRYNTSTRVNLLPNDGNYAISPDCNGPFWAESTEVTPISGWRLIDPFEVAHASPENGARIAWAAIIVSLPVIGYFCSEGPSKIFINNLVFQQEL